MLLGLNKTPQEFPFSDAVLREVNLQTSAAHACSDDIPLALEILKSGEVAQLLTERVVQLEDIKDAFVELSSGLATGKLLITPLKKGGVLKGVLHRQTSATLRPINGQAVQRL